MRFHDYKTMRPAGVRGTSLDWIRTELLRPAEKKEDFAWMLRSMVEASWLLHDRPFYNVYPIAVELCNKLSLSMTWGDITLPTKYLLLRFPQGQEPHGLQAVLAKAPSDQQLSTRVEVHGSRMNALSAMKTLELCASVQASGKCYGWAYQSTDGPLRQQNVFDSCWSSDSFDLAAWGDGISDIPQAHLHGNFVIRILAFIGLLSKGQDLITPAVLAADRDEYDNTSDEAKRRWLEQRAAKRQGVGFDVGRSLEIERSKSPHWRSPHLALFHTGPGRTVPCLKVRSGCVVIPRELASVPTGYMGCETVEEAIEADSPAAFVFRVAIPKRLRFKVMRRDKFRCQLCGLTQKDGVRLEVDHKVPVAEGGRNVIENLWTLCHPCNNGKSDMPLQEATAAN
jgi:hypothetical protein